MILRVAKIIQKKPVKTHGRSSLSFTSEQRINIKENLLECRLAKQLYEEERIMNCLL